MKRLVRTVLKAMWRRTESIRRPILLKVERFLTRCFRPTERFMIDETTVLMDHVVRELVRLQRQVDALQQTIEDLAPARDGLAIAGEIDPSHEQLKAG